MLSSPKCLHQLKEKEEKEKHASTTGKGKAKTGEKSEEAAKRIGAEV